MQLPFRDQIQTMPNNYMQAKSYAEALKKSIEARLYRFMESLEGSRYAERILETESDRQDGRIWYIPHHVHNTKKPEKVRVVFNCPATWKPEGGVTQI